MFGRGSTIRLGASPIGTRTFPASNNRALELTPPAGGIGRTRRDVVEAGAAFSWPAAARIRVGSRSVYWAVLSGCLRAIATAWARDGTPSFVRIAEKWCSTVLVERNRRFANCA